MEDDEIPQDHHGPCVDYVHDYTITYLSAPVALIRVPFEIDDRLQELLDSAFLSFWTDSHTCANKLRQVLESLLDEKPETRNKENWVSLGNMIKKFLLNPSKFPLKEHLNALKILGDLGSHPTNGKIERLDLMMAFKVLESLLEELYRDTDRIDKLSEEIKQRSEGK